MIEATASAQTRAAIAAAHDARGQALRDLLRMVRNLYKRPVLKSNAPALAR